MDLLREDLLLSELLRVGVRERLSVALGEGVVVSVGVREGELVRDDELLRVELPLTARV
jgi:hypothetical protein